MKIEDVTGGKVKIGNTVYNMVEAKYNGVVVWPASASQYVIVPGTITLHFSAGNILYANGQNCVEYITANVQNTATGVVTQNVTLTPTLESGSAYYIGVGGSIWGPNLGTTETGLHSESVTVTYQNASATVTIQQEANIRTVTRTDYGTWTETSRTPSGNPYDYHVSIAADRYTLATSSDECPASGGSATLYFPSGTCYHKQDYNVTRTRTVTEYCTYTATGSTVHAEPRPNQTNSYTDYTQVTDTPTISGSATGFSRSGYNVTIENRGQIEGSARSVTYTATNNNVTDTVTIYQEENRKEAVYSYSLAVSILGSGNIPASGGRIGVGYTSLRTTYYEYTSGAQSTPSTAQFTSAVSVSSFATSEVNTVTGNGTFYVNVPANDSYTQERTLVVQITADQAHWASDDKTQDAQEVPAALEGITILAESGEWVLGTIKTGQTPYGPVSGIIIARKSANTVNAHVTYSGISWSYAANPSATPPVMESHNDSGTQTVVGGVTLELTPYEGTLHTYYGYWLVTQDYPYGVTPRTLLSISSISSFTVWEE